MKDTSLSHRHQFTQIWLLLAGVIVFALYVIFDRSYLQTMFLVDESYLSSVILIAFICASGHAAWYIFSTSSSIEEGLKAASADAQFFAFSEGEHDKEAPQNALIRDYIADLSGERRAQSPNDPASAGTSYVLEIYADRLRAPVELGWYMVDILIRIGLIGTIIGFILILGALADGPPPTGDNIQALLISMSGGMGTALYTTLAGLVTATLLGLQYSVLSRSVERLVGLLIQIRNRAAELEAS